jgi:dihydrofolate reductase/thymidylate synthase
MTNFSLIVATDKEYGIGKDRDMPWDLPGELKHFQDVTKGEGNNVVIMGRVTWESIPVKHRPLVGRKNIVLTRNVDYDLPQGVERAGSLDEALELISDETNEVFVIGGGRVYHEGIQHPDCSRIYRTVIDGDFDCDTFFPRIYDDCFELVEESEPVVEDTTSYKFYIYIKLSK